MIFVHKNLISNPLTYHVHAKSTMPYLDEEPDHHD